jgi:glycosyltransferase involved in cell wall biosynthesis
MLIEAYRQIPNRRLVIVSNWGTSEYGLKLKDENKDKYPNIYLQDAVYNLDELNAIRSNGQIYFHTHSLCGTAPSLTEAMSLGLPVICFDVNTNRSSTEEKSFYFKDAKSLAAIIDSLDESIISLLGKNMIEIANRRYNWKRIAEIYRKCIK